MGIPDQALRQVLHPLSLGEQGVHVGGHVGGQVSMVHAGVLVGEPGEQRLGRREATGGLSRFVRKCPSPDAPRRRLCNGQVVRPSASRASCCAPSFHCL